LSRAKLAPAANWTLTAEEDSLARAEVGYSVAD
jgi:hypothetical protein